MAWYNNWLKKPEPVVVEEAPKGIVSGVGISANVSPINDNKLLGKRLEEAMSKAVMDCYSSGIIDPKEHKARMMEARARVLAEI